MIGPPYNVINISHLEMYSNNSFPILFIIIVKRGNMLRNKEDNIVKWL